MVTGTEPLRLLINYSLFSAIAVPNHCECLFALQSMAQRSMACAHLLARAVVRMACYGRARRSVTWRDIAWQSKAGHTRAYLHGMASHGTA